MKNRRRFPRFEFPLEVKYSLYDNASQASYSVLSNISRGGLCMPAISAILKAGDLVRLDINSVSNNRVPVTGKVRWTRKLDRKAPLDEEVGIEFIDAPVEGIDKLLPV